MILPEVIEITDFLFNPVTVTGALLTYSVVTGEYFLDPIKLAISFGLSYIYLAIGMSVCLHRFFAHKAFETSRVFQFCLGVIGSLANQKGILWWASKHNKHHKYCDRPEDPHSWCQTSYLYSFLGWTYYEQKTELQYVAARYVVPELLLLNDHHYLPRIIFAWLLTHFYGFEWMIYLFAIPSIICALGSLQFNLAFHPKNNNKVCKAINQSITYTAASLLVGESAHEEHHTRPYLSRRGPFDMGYNLFLFPLSKLGIIRNLR
jgi:stearoyl-CoA desaturase (delta-9 desaturase)